MRTTPPPPRHLIVDWLKRRLSSGPVASEELFGEAARLDVSAARLRTAGRSLDVRVWKDGYQGKWLWMLPDDSPTALERELEKEVEVRKPVSLSFPERKSVFDSMRLSGVSKEE